MRAYGLFDGPHGCWKNATLEIYDILVTRLYQFPMKTKVKIIKQAIALFNERGVSNVSVAHISDALGISKGNFTYHFANKALLLDAVFDFMAHDIGSRIAEADLEQNDVSLTSYLLVIAYTEAFTSDFSFFYTDLLDLSRSYPAVAARYDALITARKAQGLALMHQWETAGLLIAEPAPDHYQHIYHAIWMILTFWRTQQLLRPADNQERSMARQVFHVLQPYLTTEGHTQCERAFMQINT